MDVIGIDARAVALFHSKTRQTGTCIEWQGEIDKDGYGKFPLRRGGSRKRWMAHRFAYVMAKGAIPNGHEVDHRCRNRRCVNPDHLEAVTPRENHDRWSKAITHCPAGHEYTPENTYRHPKNGARRCRTCVRSWRDRIYTGDIKEYWSATRAKRAKKAA